MSKIQKKYIRQSVHKMFWLEFVSADTTRAAHVVNSTYKVDYTCQCIDFKQVGSIHKPINTEHLEEFFLRGKFGTCLYKFASLYFHFSIKYMSVFVDRSDTFK